MSARELQEWWIAYQCEPWGEVRADLRMGILASTMVTLWSAPSSKRLSPQDFMPDFFPAAPRRSAPSRQTSQQMFTLLMQGTRAVGGTIDPRLHELASATLTPEGSQAAGPGETRGMPDSMETA